MADNKQSGLEEILKPVYQVAEAGNHIEDLFHQFQKEPTSNEAIMGYVNFASVPNESKPEFYEALRKKSPAVVGGYMQEEKQRYDVDLATRVKDNYAAIVGGANKDQLVFMALGASGVLDKSKKMQQHLQEKEFDEVKKLLTEKYKNYATWVKFINEDADPQDLMELSSSYLRGLQDSFLGKYTDQVKTGKKTKDGKEEVLPVANEQKLRTYLTEAVSGLDDKKSLGIYYGAGQGLYQYATIENAKKEAAKKKKEAEAAKNIPPKNVHKLKK